MHVLRLAEQRIARRVDLVKHEPRMERAEPERLVGADDVHLVAAIRQRLSQLGRDDAAAAHRGVTDDADIHGNCGARPTGSTRASDAALGSRRRTFGEGDAGQRAELRVTAFDELLEAWRRQARRHRFARPTAGIATCNRPARGA